METIAEQREARRRKAWELHENGWSQVDIAEALSVTEGAVSQWFKAARHHGVQALRAVPHAKTPSRLTDSQRAELLTLLEMGAEKFGFEGEVWTSARVAVLIERVYGVHYHPESVRLILHACGWSYQKPTVRASQRNEKGIAEWVQSKWPEIKKKRTTKVERSSSSTSQASIFYRPSSKRGRRKVKLPSSPRH